MSIIGTKPADHKEQFYIDFEPIGRRGEYQPGQSLLECAGQFGVELVSLCGGEGTCGNCKVQSLVGVFSAITANELASLSTQELEQGYRLACQVSPLSSCKVHVPVETMSAPQRIQVEGFENLTSLDPPVRRYPVKLNPPSIENPQADASNLLEALEEQHGVHGCTFDINVLKQLSGDVRANGWKTSPLIRKNEIISLARPYGRLIGLAIDLGTTKLAGYLVDLEDGRTLAMKGVMNPQIAYGEDLLSRITYSEHVPSGAMKLQSLVVDAINQLALDLCSEAAVSMHEIVESVVAANTAMHHFFLGLPVRQLAYAPYVPALGEGQDLKARDLGLDFAPGAYIHVLPNVAGFVGADHVAMLLATGARETSGTTLALDIGTNTEVCLVHRGELTCLSCASGPAFEGAHIKHGMRASDGAIEHVRFVNQQIEYQTIGAAPPVGICGSGILSAIAQLYLAGILDRRGRLLDHPRVRQHGNEREFLLVNGVDSQGIPEITITQNDVREIQLAKGAIKTGIQVLLEAYDIPEGAIGQVIIAGAFGSYIDIGSALTIKLLPALPLDRFKQVGNAAGMGAKMALLSRTKRQEAQVMARQIRYIEMAAAPGFMRAYAKAMFLG